MNSDVLPWAFKFFIFYFAFLASYVREMPWYLYKAPTMEERRRRAKRRGRSDQAYLPWVWKRTSCWIRESMTKARCSMNCMFLG